MIVKDPVEIDRLAERCSESAVVVYDLETDGLSTFKGNQLIGVALALPHSGSKWDTFYVPFRHLVGENAPAEHLVPLLEAVLGSPGDIIGFNLKFDFHFSRAEGVKVARQPWDVMLACHLNDENEENFELKGLGSRHIDPSAADEEKKLSALLKSRKLNKGQLALLTPEEVAPYAEMDVKLTGELYRWVKPKLMQQNLWKLWGMSNDYMLALLEMESAGMVIDEDRAFDRQLYARTMADQIKQRMCKIAGYDFNPRSVPQLKKVLGTNGSTDKKARARMAHPIAALVGEQRAWEKAYSSFYVPLLGDVGGDGRAHANFRQIGTVTGRLSCSGVNYQALPRESDNETSQEGPYHARDLIEAPPGFSIVGADYSQIELRLLAYYTQSPFLLRVYQDDALDIHQEMADSIRVSRDIAKRVNFGATYGIGAEALAGLPELLSLNMTVEEAEVILRRYHKRVPEVKELYDRAQRMAERNGYIQMWTGRRRHYGPIDEWYRAMSNLIQGGVGEIMRVSITRIWRELPETKMFLQVHDDILSYVEDRQISVVVPRLKAIMEDFRFKNVPIKADVKIGKSWGKMTKWGIKEEVNS